MTVVEYNPATESLTQLLSDISSSLNGEKAKSVTLAVADNNAEGFALVSGETATTATIATEASFWNGVASLLTSDGTVSATGDASLAADGHSSLEASLANAVGHEVSFIDASTGSATFAFADSQNVNVYFIDPLVQDASSVVDSLPDGSQVVYLAKDGDGVAEITSYLASHSNIDSINIVAHGFTGYIYLGKDLVDSSSLTSTYASEVASWGKSLSSDGAINIYSCLTASDASGKAFVDEFATLTGATVEASTNVTGVDGDWTLEYASSANVTLSSLDVHNYSYDLDIIGTWANMKTAIEVNHISTIMLSADITLVNTDSSITVDYNAQATKAVTIYGNSHVIGNSSGAAFTSTYFVVTGAGTSLTISDLTISGAQRTAITVAAGTSLSCTNCVFSSDTDLHNDNGGAISNAGTLTLTSCTFSSDSVNTAMRGGGAIYNTGALTATSCVFSSDSASGCNGGALANYGGQVTLKACLFNSDSAGSYGGAVYTNGGTLTANSCTFYSDHSYGGGALFISAGSVTLNACTLASNYITGGSHASGGAVCIEGGTLTIENSIIASNLDVATADDVSVEGGSCTSGGWNIFGAIAGFTLAATDQTYVSGNRLWASNANGSTLSSSPVFNSSTGAVYIYSGSGAMAFSKITSANNYNNQPGYDIRGTIAFTGNRDIGSFQCSRGSSGGSSYNGYNYQLQPLSSINGDMSNGAGYSDGSWTSMDFPSLGASNYNSYGDFSVDFSACAMPGYSLSSPVDFAPFWFSDIGLLMNNDLFKSWHPDTYNMLASVCQKTGDGSSIANLDKIEKAGVAACLQKMGSLFQDSAATWLLLQGYSRSTDAAGIAKAAELKAKLESDQKQINTLSKYLNDVFQQFLQLQRQAPPSLWPDAPAAPGMPANDLFASLDAATAQDGHGFQLLSNVDARYAKSNVFKNNVDCLLDSFVAV